MKQRLELRESPEKGIYTQGLSHHIVKTMGECIKLMDKGWLSRSTGATLMNAESSRLVIETFTQLYMKFKFLKSITNYFDVSVRN